MKLDRNGLTEIKNCQFFPTKKFQLPLISQFVAQYVRPYYI